jgi:hypothetical protein
MTTITKAPPQFGWIKGQFPGGKAELNFDRRQQTVQGDSFNDRVQLSTNNDSGQVSGTAHGKPVDLHMDWSPTVVKLDGWANGARFDVTVDYQQHRATGQAGDKQIALNFDNEQGFIKGKVGADAVDLHLSHDGQLQGTSGAGRVQAEMMNLDLGDFIRHYYLVSQ